MFRFSAIAPLVAATSTALIAQTADSTRLPRVVITATRLDSRIGSDIASVTVLDGDTLRARGIRYVAEALREVPGATVVRSGSVGALTSLFLRGGESDYVRVLIDGVPMNDPGGSIDLSKYTLDNVDRIEVVRGPASVLYGSDAVAGVVQIFTRQHSAPLIVEGSASAGTFASRAADVSLGATASVLSVTAGAARYETDGFLAFNNRYDNDVLSARIAATPGRGFRASLSGRQHNDEFHYPTDGAGKVVDRNSFRTDRRSAVAFDARQSIGARVNVGFALTAMDGRPRTDDASDGASDNTGFYAYRSSGAVRRRLADSRVDVLLPGNAIATLGYEWQREAQRGRDSSNFDTAPNAFSAKRTTRATYAQIVGEASRLSFTLGGRYDDNDVFGVFRTARGGLAWRVGQGTTLRANAGSAFKAPTFLEEFNTAFTVGNASLRPEHSRSYEIGATQLIASVRGELTATWFAQRFRDLIQYSFVNPATPNYFNVAAASARGLEIEGRSRVGAATQLGLTLTFLRTRVDDAGFDQGQEATFVQGNRLLRRPSASGALTASSRLTSRLTIDGRLLFVGSRDDRDFSGFPAKPVILESHRRLDGGLAYRLTNEALRGPSLTLYVRAENLFDTEYQEIMNFSAPGRTVSLGLRASARR
ncbi:MAG TPA: TonB-dependent receptor [Gemmatimonadaceae bacterium]|nr:TonB-dependent receptor [Gemmatimonadaceae bacterium]